MDIIGANFLLIDMRVREDRLYLFLLVSYIRRLKFEKKEMTVYFDPPLY